MFQKVINIVYTEDIMSFCPECGTKNESNTAFCSNCGKNLKTDNLGSPEQTNMSNPNMPPAAMPFNSANANFLGIRPPKTTQLKWVQGFNWFNFVLFLLAGFGLIFAGFTGGNGLEGLEFIGYGVLFLAGITYLFIWGLNNYNNNIRIVYGVFCILGLLGALGTFNIISIAINGFQIYTVFIHAPTVALFKQVQSY